MQSLIVPCKRELIVSHHILYTFLRFNPFLQLCSPSLFCSCASIYQLFLTLWSLCIVVQVNGTPVHGLQHSEVVAAIKAGGDELRLLVVDPETDAFFISCQVLPTEEHLTGKQQ